MLSTDQTPIMSGTARAFIFKIMIPIERRISDDTRLIDLTVGELKELFSSLVPKVTPVVPAQPKMEKHLVYGIKGIRDLFQVSDSTARKLKDGCIKKAVSQSGRTIVVDVDMALSLFSDKH